MAYQSQVGLAQGLVSDVHIRMLDSARLEILYNLNGPADSVWFETEARFGGQLHPNSKFLYGDFGPNVRSGSNRRIVWNLYDEGQRIKSDIRVRVLARGLQLPGPIIKESLDAIVLTPRPRQRRRWAAVRWLTNVPLTVVRGWRNRNPARKTVSMER